MPKKRSLLSVVAEHPVVQAMLNEQTKGIFALTVAVGHVVHHVCHGHALLKQDVTRQIRPLREYLAQSQLLLPYCLVKVEVMYLSWPGAAALGMRLGLGLGLGLRE